MLGVLATALLLIVTNFSWSYAETASFIVVDSSPKNEQIPLPIADLIEVQLSQRKDFEVLNRSALKSILKEKPFLSNDGNFSALSSAQYVLTFQSYSLPPGELVIWARVHRIADGLVCSAPLRRGKMQSVAEIVNSLVSEVAICQARGTSSAPDRDDEALDEHNRGISFFLMKDWELAIAAFRNSLALDPSSTDTRYWLMQAYLGNSKIEEARIEARRFLKDCPDDPKIVKVKEVLEKLQN